MKIRKELLMEFNIVLLKALELTTDLKFETPPFIDERVGREPTKWIKPDKDLQISIRNQFAVVYKDLLKIANCIKVDKTMFHMHVAFRRLKYGFYENGKTLVIGIKGKSDIRDCIWDVLGDSIGSENRLNNQMDLLNYFIEFRKNNPDGYIDTRRDVVVGLGNLYYTIDRLLRQKNIDKAIDLVQKYNSNTVIEVDPGKPTSDCIYVRNMVPYHIEQEGGFQISSEYTEDVRTHINNFKLNIIRYMDGIINYGLQTSQKST